MSRFEKNFDNYGLLNDWYAKAAGMEFAATWGSLPLFKGGDIQHMNFMRVQTMWLESTYDDMQARRRALQAIASVVLSPDSFPDEELLKWWSLFGTESLSGKLADAICTLYNDSPFRTFSPDTGVQSAFSELYETFEVNHAMKDAYRASLFTNVVVLIPDWETKQIRALTPDYFRLVGKDELWIAKGNGGWNEKEFLVWSAETLKIVDHSGKLKTSKPNPYGRIPAVILKLNRSNDIYGSGISESAEISVLSNYIRFLTTRLATFQSFSVLFGTNLGDKVEKGTRVGPGYILNVDNKGGEPGQQGTLEYLNPESQITTLESYRDSIISSFERNQGLPGFMVDENSDPPSGVALQVLERQLNRKRKEHIHALTKAEKDLVSLIALQAKIEGGRTLTAETFGVQYEDPETFNNAGDELDYDIIRMGQGLVSPSELVLKYYNQRMSDDEAAAFIAKNKSYFPGAAVPEVKVSNENL